MLSTQPRILRFSSYLSFECGFLKKFSGIIAAMLIEFKNVSVERDGRGCPTDAHAPEAPTRLAKYLGQIVRGAVAVGLDRREALRLAVRIGHDCIPPMRVRALGEVASQGGRITAELARAMQKPTTSVDRVLQELHLLGLLEVTTADGETRWRYHISAAVDVDALDSVVRFVQ